MHHFTEIVASQMKMPENLLHCSQKQFPTCSLPLPAFTSHTPQLQVTTNCRCIADIKHKQASYSRIVPLGSQRSTPGEKKTATVLFVSTCKMVQSKTLYMFLHVWCADKDALLSCFCMWAILSSFWSLSHFLGEKSQIFSIQLTSLFFY